MARRARRRCDHEHLWAFLGIHDHGLTSVQTVLRSNNRLAGSYHPSNTSTPAPAPVLAAHTGDLVGDNLGDRRYGEGWAPRETGRCPFDRTDVLTRSPPRRIGGKSPSSVHAV